MINRPELIGLIENGDITCEPIFDSQVSIGSIDVRLSNIIKYPVPGEIGYYDFEVAEDGHLKVKAIDIEYREYDLNQCVFKLKPGRFILASTIETIGQKSLKYQSKIFGKSTIARCGLSIECAGLIEAGNQLQVTLEIANLGNIPVCLRYGMQIAQVEWMPVIGESSKGYTGKYLNAVGVGIPQ